MERGNISQRLDGDWITMRQGDTLLVPAGTVHQTRNRGQDDAVLVVAYSAGARLYEDIP